MFFVFQTGGPNLAPRTQASAAQKLDGERNRCLAILNGAKVTVNSKGEAILDPNGSAPDAARRQEAAMNLAASLSKENNADTIRSWALKIMDAAIHREDRATGAPFGSIMLTEWPEGRITRLPDNAETVAIVFRAAYLATAASPKIREGLLDYFQSLQEADLPADKADAKTWIAAANQRLAAWALADYTRDLGAHSGEERDWLPKRLVHLLGDANHLMATWAEPAAYEPVLSATDYDRILPHPDVPSAPPGVTEFQFATEALRKLSFSSTPSEVLAGARGLGYISYSPGFGLQPDCEKALFDAAQVNDACHKDADVQTTLRYEFAFGRAFNPEGQISGAYGPRAATYDQAAFGPILYGLKRSSVIYEEINAKGALGQPFKHHLPPDALNPALANHFLDLLKSYLTTHRSDATKVRPDLQVGGKPCSELEYARWVCNELYTNLKPYGADTPEGQLAQRAHELLANPDPAISPWVLAALTGTPRAGGTTVADRMRFVPPVFRPPQPYFFSRGFGPPLYLASTNLEAYIADYLRGDPNIAAKLLRTYQHLVVLDAEIQAAISENRPRPLFPSMAAAAEPFLIKSFMLKDPAGHIAWQDTKWKYLNGDAQKYPGMTPAEIAYKEFMAGDISVIFTRARTAAEGGTNEIPGLISEAGGLTLDNIYVRHLRYFGALQINFAGAAEDFISWYSGQRDTGLVTFNNASLRVETYDTESVTLKRIYTALGAGAELSTNASGTALNTIVGANFTIGLPVGGFLLPKPTAPNPGGPIEPQNGGIGQWAADNFGILDVSPWISVWSQPGARTFEVNRGGVDLSNRAEGFVSSRPWDLGLRFGVTGARTSPTEWKTRAESHTRIIVPGPFSLFEFGVKAASEAGNAPSFTRLTCAIFPQLPGSFSPIKTQFGIEVDPKAFSGSKPDIPAEFSAHVYIPLSAFLGKYGGTPGGGFLDRVGTQLTYAGAIGAPYYAGISLFYTFDGSPRPLNLPRP